jgi:hypothetical protein
MMPLWVFAALALAYAPDVRPVTWGRVKGFYR